MATNAFNSVYHHHSLRRRRHSLDYHPITNSVFLRPIAAAAAATLTHSVSNSAVSSAPTSTNPSTSQNVSFDLLEQHLSVKNFRQADEETRRLLIVLAGDAAQSRGYVFFSEVQFISDDDLKAMDDLWRQHSDDKFGYSVQKRIWKKTNKDFTKFFIKVGWMKKLESPEVVQYNYRSFPTEFMWEMEDNPPEGHLPLTNALRGTQLLNNIFNHPAFEGGEEEKDGEEERDNAINKPLSRSFKTSYTF